MRISNCCLQLSPCTNEQYRECNNIHEGVEKELFRLKKAKRRKENRIENHVALLVPAINVNNIEQINSNNGNDRQK